MTNHSPPTQPGLQMGWSPLKKKKGKQPISTVYFQNTSSLSNPKEDSLFGMETEDGQHTGLFF